MAPILGAFLDYVPLSPQFIGEPGAPTAWHGAALNDYHAFHTARCLATGFAIFVVHCYMYVKIIHGQPSAALRLALTTLSTGAYFAAVLRLHPWQPYWIRELSVMLAQLYAWKVTGVELAARLMLRVHKKRGGAKPWAAGGGWGVGSWVARVKGGGRVNVYVEYGAIKSHTLVGSKARTVGTWTSVS